MATSPNTFFRFLAENSDLVVAVFHHQGEVDEAALLALLERHRSDSQPATEHRRWQLEELGIIERAAHADAVFELSRPVMDLLEWLTRRQRLSSATVLRAYLDELGAAGVEMDEAVRGGDVSAAALALKEIDGPVERVRVLSEANRESIVSEAQALRSATSDVSAVDRFTIVRRLWERYLVPLRQLVNVEGEMEKILDRLQESLGRGEQRFLAHGFMQQAFARATARLVRMRRAVSVDHHAAMTEIAPLYERLRRDSRLVRGASRALARVRSQGAESLKLDQRMGLTGWRTRYLLSDEKLRARFAALVGYEPARPTPIAEAQPPPDLLLITRAELENSIAAEVPIEDVLAFVLARWPEYPLAAQLRAFGLVAEGNFGTVALVADAGPKIYPIPGGEIEAWPIALEQVTR